jgi:hypothetical protein
VPGISGRDPDTRRRDAARGGAVAQGRSSAS